MKFYRNPEIQKELLFYGVLTILAMGSMGLWQGRKSALGAGVICLVFVACVIHINRRRYETVAMMGEQIDKILHGEDVCMMDNCVEGDLAVLSTQISKIVRSLQEQQDNLQKENSLLADSMADR